MPFPKSQFGVIVEGRERLRKMFRAAPSIVDDEESTGYANIIGRVVPAIQKYTPVHTGTLRDSIRGFVEKKGRTKMVVFEAGNVADVVVASVEHGAKPHWPPWGPGSALAGWAESKGIPPFLVARAIARRGTIKRFGYKGAAMFQRGLKDSLPFIADEMGRVEERIADRLRRA